MPNTLATARAIISESPSAAVGRQDSHQPSGPPQNDSAYRPPAAATSNSESAAPVLHGRRGSATRLVDGKTPSTGQSESYDLIVNFVPDGVVGWKEGWETRRSSITNAFTDQDLAGINASEREYARYVANYSRKVTVLAVCAFLHNLGNLAYTLTTDAPSDDVQPLIVGVVLCGVGCAGIVCSEWVKPNQDASIDKQRAYAGMVEKVRVAFLCIMVALAGIFGWASAADNVFMLFPLLLFFNVLLGVFTGVRFLWLLLFWPVILLAYVIPIVIRSWDVWNPGQRAVFFFASMLLPIQLLFVVKELENRDRDRFAAFCNAHATRQRFLESEAIATRLLRSITPHSLAPRFFGTVDTNTVFKHEFAAQCAIAVVALPTLGSWASSMVPMDAVRAINAVFSRFDGILSWFEGKTRVRRAAAVGDNYVFTGGLFHGDHAPPTPEAVLQTYRDIVLVARSVLAVAEEVNDARTSDIERRNAVRRNRASRASPRADASASGGGFNRRITDVASMYPSFASRQSVGSDTDAAPQDLVSDLVLGIVLGNGPCFAGLHGEQEQVRFVVHGPGLADALGTRRFSASERSSILLSRDLVASAIAHAALTSSGHHDAPLTDAHAAPVPQPLLAGLQDGTAGSPVDKALTALLTPDIAPLWNLIAVVTDQRDGAAEAYELIRRSANLDEDALLNRQSVRSASEGTSTSRHERQLASFVPFAARSTEAASDLRPVETQPPGRAPPSATTVSRVTPSDRRAAPATESDNAADFVAAVVGAAALHETARSAVFGTFVDHVVECDFRAHAAAQRSGIVAKTLAITNGTTLVFVLTAIIWFPYLGGLNRDKTGFAVRGDDETARFKLIIAFCCFVVSTLFLGPVAAASRYHARTADAQNEEDDDYANAVLKVGSGFDESLLLAPRKRQPDRLALFLETIGLSMVCAFGMVGCAIAGNASIIGTNPIGLFQHYAAAIVHSARWQSYVAKSALIMLAIFVPGAVTFILDPRDQTSDREPPSVILGTGVLLWVLNSAMAWLSCRIARDQYEIDRLSRLVQRSATLRIALTRRLTRGLVPEHLIDAVVMRFHESDHAHSALAHLEHSDEDRLADLLARRQMSRQRGHAPSEAALPPPLTVLRKPLLFAPPHGGGSFWQRCALQPLNKMTSTYGELCVVALRFGDSIHAPKSNPGTPQVKGDSALVRSAGNYQPNPLASAKGASLHGASFLRFSTDERPPQEAAEVLFGGPVLHEASVALRTLHQIDAAVATVPDAYLRVVAVLGDTVTIAGPVGEPPATLKRGGGQRGGDEGPDKRGDDATDSKAHRSGDEAAGPMHAEAMELRDLAAREAEAFEAKRAARRAREAVTIAATHGCVSVLRQLAASTMRRFSAAAVVDSGIGSVIGDVTTSLRFSVFGVAQRNAARLLDACPLQPTGHGPAEDSPCFAVVSDSFRKMHDRMTVAAKSEAMLRAGVTNVTDLSCYDFAYDPDVFDPPSWWRVDSLGQLQIFRLRLLRRSAAELFVSPLQPVANARPRPATAAAHAQQHVDDGDGADDLAGRQSPHSVPSSSMELAFVASNRVTHPVTDPQARSPAPADAVASPCEPSRDAPVPRQQRSSGSE